MKELKQQFKPKSLSYFFVGVFILIFFVRIGFETTTWLYEGVMPTSHWYSYEDIIPTKENFNKGDKITFNSVVERNRDILMDWQDTLRCRDLEGGVTKYPTQYWPEDRLGEFVSADIRDEFIVNQDWAYTAAEIDPEEVQCKMYSVIIGTTAHGHKKKTTFIGEWFGVNK